MLRTGWGGATALAAVLCVGAGAAVVAQLPVNAEHQAIKYSSSTPTDAITRLQKQIDSGATTLAFEPGRGYLRAVLQALRIPVSSQGLVFSRTSLQLDRIAPWSPRALYFNDDVYVGWVQGGPILEVASVDPKLGAVFYSLAQEPSAKPQFAREGSTCLVCHDSSSITGGVPGLIMRSVLPDRYGYSMSTLRDGPTTDQMPLDLRWGGWYVTGTHGEQSHMGNLMAPVLAHEAGNPRTYMTRVGVTRAQNVTDLGSRFDTEPYLSPYSDIAGLMVFAHQTHVHNLITIAHYEARKALYEEELAGRSGAAHSERTLERVRATAEPLVRAMLFVKEAPLAAPLEGTSGFAEEFAALGPRDARGRSLRELDLERRLFKYPLSYLVYSESFDALPAVVKGYVYRRFREVLAGHDATMTHLSTADRQAVLEILQATKPDFAAVE
jgi:hypothetical protein